MTSEYKKGYQKGVELAKNDRACPCKGKTEFTEGRYDGWHDTVITMQEEASEAEEQQRDYEEWAGYQDEGYY